MKTIECTIDDNVFPDNSWSSLKIDGLRNGIRIDARDIVSDTEGFSFNLIVHYQLSYEFAEVFKNISNGMVLSLEEPNSGGIGVLRLGDPDVRPAIPNFSGSLASEESSTAYFGETFGLRVSARTEFDQSAPVYLRVCLQKLLSNCVSITPASAALVNFEEM